MDTLIEIANDLTVLIFNLALFVAMTPLKKENKTYYGFMYGGTLLITIAYVVAVYVLGVPYAIATVMCMTIPSLILFFCLSKYKNARFIVTFCFVDTVTFIIAFFSKAVQVLGGPLGNRISLIALLILCVGGYLLLRPYCARYRNLMGEVATGWGPMAFCTVLIYAMLFFVVAYPAPLVTRLEYVPSYAAICITVLSFYSVFLMLLIQKAKLAKMNTLLQQQQHWQHMAYIDDLTQLENQAAYASRVETLEHQKTHDKTYSVILFDIDNFKHINDTYGHHIGNVVLRNTADFFSSTYPKDHYEFFRVGGDEFAAIVTDVPNPELLKQVQTINTMTLQKDPGCTYSCGWANVDFSQINAFETAFIQADKSMYQVKSEKKLKRK